jgi:hypothetical protein
MKNIFVWLSDNKGWVFSGVGVSAVGGVVAIISKIFRSTGEGVTQNPSINQSPSLNQSPIVNITNNAVSPVLLGTSNPKSTNEAPLFSVNPIVVERRVEVIDANVDDNGTITVCVARFKMRNDLQASIQHRFEVSIDYVERLHASGMPYEKRVAHINQAQWLPPNNGVHELLLAVESGQRLHAVSAADDRWEELNLQQDRPFVTVILTDLTDGRKWECVYALTYHPLAVRQIVDLRRK